LFVIHAIVVTGNTTVKHVDCYFSRL